MTVVMQIFNACKTVCDLVSLCDCIHYAMVKGETQKYMGSDCELKSLDAVPGGDSQQPRVLN